jgi:hypothetical protein
MRSAGTPSQPCRGTGHTIGPRNVYHYDALQEAAGYLTRSFERLGYRPELQEFMARGRRFANIGVEMPGNTLPGEILVVGAHYDTHKHSPGANDNASAVAALLELAGHFAKRQLARTVRFLAFTNEETPFTRTRHMGSRMYARACRAKHENIVGMLCLETIGYCSDEQGSQWLSFGGLLLSQLPNATPTLADPPMPSTAERKF